MESKLDERRGEERKRLINREKAHAKEIGEFGVLFYIEL